MRFPTSAFSIAAQQIAAKLAAYRQPMGEPVDLPRTPTRGTSALRFISARKGHHATATAASPKVVTDSGNKLT